MMNRLRFFIFIFFFFSSLEMLVAATDSSFIKLLRSDKVGIVLGGGGARGLAHIGVLKALHEYGIEPHVVGGTSVGAIIGAVYAMGYTPSELESIFTQVDYDYIYSNRVFRIYDPIFFRNYEYRSILRVPFKGIRYQIPSSYARKLPSISLYNSLLVNKGKPNSFNSLEKSFFCVSTSVDDKKAFEHTEGNLIKAIMASSAFPLLFPPQSINSSFYADGGIVNNFPVEFMCNKGVNYIIGVDVDDHTSATTGTNAKRGSDASLSAIGLVYSLVLGDTDSPMKKKRALCDLFIHPPVDGISTFDVSFPERIIAMGYNETRRLLDSLFISEDFKVVIKKDIAEEFDIIQSVLERNFSFDAISITGRRKKYTYNYLRKKFTSSYPFTKTLGDVQRDIKELDATGAFRSLYFDMQPSTNGSYTISLDAIEKTTDYELLVGGTYSDHYYAEFMLGLKWNSFLIRNSYLMVQLMLGSQLRYNVDFYIDRGVIPSFGFSSSFYWYRFFNSIDPTNLQGSQTTLAQYNFRHRFYIQSQIKNLLTLQAGIGFNYALQSDEPAFSLFEEVTAVRTVRQFNVYVEASYDDLDNLQFPMNGIKASTVFKAIDLQNQILHPLYGIQIRGFGAFPLIPSKKLSLLAKGSLGIHIQATRDITSVNAFKLGGAYDYNIYNAEQLYGYSTLHFYTRNYIYWMAGLNWSIVGKLYARASLNIANLFQKTDKIASSLIYESGDTYAGLGVSIGYDAAVGPLLLGMHYSNEQNFSLFFRFGFVY